jgi:hypothetical protein
MTAARMGRPPLDPEGSVELRVRVTREQAAKLERIAKAKGFIAIDGQSERPILAAAARHAIDVYQEP